MNRLLKKKLLNTDVNRLLIRLLKWLLNRLCKKNHQIARTGSLKRLLNRRLEQSSEQAL
jgi:hypothetical protein